MMMAAKARFFSLTVVMRAFAILSLLSTVAVAANATTQKSKIFLRAAFCDAAKRHSHCRSTAPAGCRLDPQDATTLKRADHRVELENTLWGYTP
jgi:hypothetical protein